MLNRVLLERGLQFHEFASRALHHRRLTGIGALLASTLPYLPRFHYACQISCGTLTLACTDQACSWES